MTTTQRTPVPSSTSTSTSTSASASTSASSRVSPPAVGARPIATRRRSSVVEVAVGVVIAIAASTVVAYSALAAGASSLFQPLQPAFFAPFVAVGVIVAYLGWRTIARRSAHAAAILRILVPVLLVLSFVPDAVLLATGFIPDSSVAGVIALALMHVIAAVVAVVLGRRHSPAR